MGIHHGTLTLTHTHTEQPRRHAFRIITFILYYGYSMRVTVCISPGISQCVFTYKTECLYKWTVSESLLVFRCSEWVLLIISLLVFSPFLYFSHPFSNADVLFIFLHHCRPPPVSVDIPLPTSNSVIYLCMVNVFHTHCLYLALCSPSEGRW